MITAPSTNLGEKFTDLPGILPDATLIIDDGIVLFANPAASTLLEKPLDGIIGKSLDPELNVPGEVEIRPGTFVDILISSIQITGRGWTTLDIRMVDSSQTETLTGWGTPKKYAKMILIRDITSRKRIEKELEKRVKELEMLHLETSEMSEMVNLLQSCQDLNEASLVIGDYGSRLFKLGGVLYVSGSVQNVLESIASWNDVNTSPTFSIPDCWALRSGKEHINRKDGRLVCDHISQGIETLCVPMYAQGEIVGVISQIGMEQASLARAFAERVGLSLANINLKMKLHKLSTTDPLTGLNNRRYFQEAGEKEIQRANRTKESLSVLFFDVDHFKSFNDNYGHEAGDTVLKAIGDHLKKTFRNIDITARWGGEEFVVMLVSADLNEAIKKAERLRKEIEMMPTPRSFTISIGVSNYPFHADNLTILVNKADEAMYKSKEGGRNRVIAAE